MDVDAIHFAEYVADLTLTLAQMAKRLGLTTLPVLLEITCAEALNVASTEPPFIATSS